MTILGTEWPTAFPEPTLGPRILPSTKTLGEGLCCARWGRRVYSFGILKVYFNMYKSEPPHEGLLKGQKKKTRLGERRSAASTVIRTMAAAVLLLFAMWLLPPAKR